MDGSTIAAIATPAGRGGIGIVKVSGIDALDITGNIFRRSGSGTTSFQSHRLYHGHIIDPGSGRIIDEVLMGVMRAPHTYTREDVVEINAHSGHIVLQNILDLLLSQGVRLAEPGEFTQRAFLNGRIDLTQAEAVIDIISAKSHKALESAAIHLKGKMGERVSEIRVTVLNLLAEIEAAIDFSDELDTGNLAHISVKALQDGVIVPLENLIETYIRGHVFRDGIRMIIVGRPNVGKSSLMNHFLGKDRVIVTPIPGTTRDVIREGINIQGIPIVIADSAGLHSSDDPVEVIGMRKTHEEIADSEIVLLLIDAETGMTSEDLEIYENVKHKRILMVVNKVDLVKEGCDIATPDNFNHEAIVQTSALYGTGVETLKDTIINRIVGSDGPDIETSVIPSLRHKVALETALCAAKDARVNINEGAMELIAIDLAKAVDALGEIIGITDKPDLLEEIFSRFCIGK